MKLGWRALTVAVVPAVAVLLCAAPALANTANSTYTGWDYAGWEQLNQCTNSWSYSDYWGSALITGIPNPVVGVQDNAVYCGGQKSDFITQYAGAQQVSTLGIPGGSTLIGATLSGSVADSNTGVGGPFAGAVTFEVCPVMLVEASQYFCGGGVDVGVSMPGNYGQQVGFSVDVYRYVTSQNGGGPLSDVFLAPAWGGADGGLAPVNTWTLSLQYAYTPTDISWGQIQTCSGGSGCGLQYEITWNPNGNDSTVQYVLQRETLQGGNVVQGWTTVYQGNATSFATSDQTCGVGYVYRVAAVGPDAQTPWDQSGELDEYPCSVSFVSATPTSLTVSWPQVTANTQPVVVWCAETQPNGPVTCSQASTGALPSGTTSVTLTDLTPNTQYTVWACSATNMWGCPSVSPWTYAAVPTLGLNNSPSGVPYNDQPLTWNPNGNPPGTVYQVQQGSYAPDGTASYSWIYQGTATSATAPQAAGGSYGYWVFAQNFGYGGSLGYGGGDGASNGAVTQVAPVPVATAASATSVTVSWATVYQMLTTDVGCNLAPDNPTSWTAVTNGAQSWTDAGLQPDTEYYCVIYAASTNQGIQWWEGGNDVWTLANPPTGAALGSITQTSVTVSWQADGDPAGTQYQVSLYACGGANTVQTSPWETALSWTAGSLTPGACYQAAVVARNGAGTETAASWTGQAYTVPVSPATLTGADGGLGWSATAGRGYVTLSWPAVPGATGYRVWVFDGAQYESFDVGDATSWDSRKALIYPPDAALYPNVSEASKTPPVFSQNGGGLDLRDEPLDLYCTTGSAYCTKQPSENYWFSVSAYDASGDSAAYQVPGQSAPAGDYFEPTLPLQTDPNAPAITGFSAGNANGYVYGPDVTVTLQASESPSGIAAYALSNDGATWTTTAVSGCTVGQVAACGSSLDAQVPWTLTPGPGTKTVYAKVESTAGVWSAVATATVYVEPDEQAPTVDLTLDGGAASTGSTTATVATTITAPLAGQAGLTFQARYSTDGGQTWTAWQDEGSATSWTATVALPGGASGERTVLEQVEDSDQNLGQGGAAIYYAAPGAGTGAGAAESGASLPCTWPVGGKDVSATCIAQPQVDLSLSPPSSAVLMRASLDGADWGAWVPVAGSLPVNLGSAPGLKTVWVQYQDALGDVTADPAFDPAYYVLDPGPPTVQASWLGGASATDSSGGATLQVQATDPVGTTGMTLAVSENGTYLYRGAFEGMVPLTLTGSGYQQVQVTVTDAAGNAATASLGIYVQ